MQFRLEQRLQLLTRFHFGFQVPVEQVRRQRQTAAAEAAAAKASTVMAEMAATATAASRLPVARLCLGLVAEAVVGLAEHRAP